jgi:hypothetical protein
MGRPGKKPSARLYRRDQSAMFEIPNMSHSGQKVPMDPSELILGSPEQIEARFPKLDAGDWRSRRSSGYFAKKCRRDGNGGWLVQPPDCAISLLSSTIIIASLLIKLTSPPTKAKDFHFGHKHFHLFLSFLLRGDVYECAL